MSLTKLYAANKKAETSGIELKIGTDADAPVFVIARASRTNPRYQRMVEAKTKPIRRQLESKTLPPKVAEQIFMEVFCETVLLGWRNVPKSDVTGDEKDTGYADFNKENAIALMTRLPQLYDELSAESTDFSNFREAALEDEAKN
jgi:hypothetical protein